MFVDSDLSSFTEMKGRPSVGGVRTVGDYLLSVNGKGLGGEWDEARLDKKKC